MTSYQNKAAGRFKFNQKKDMFLLQSTFFFSVEALCAALALKCEDGVHVVGEGGWQQKARESRSQRLTRNGCGCAAEESEGDKLNLSRC